MLGLFHSETGGDDFGTGVVSEWRRPMQPARIICDGVTVSSWELPPFQLCPGDLLCLHVPAPADYAEEAQLVRVLTGVETYPGLRVYGRVFNAEPARPRSGLRRLLGQPTLAHWLAHGGGITPAEATRQVEELGLHPLDRLNHVAGTPRLLLGLASVWNRGAEAIIFSTAGLDPLGREAAVNAVRSHLQTCPAILLSHPCWVNGETIRQCPPGSRCLESRRGAAA